MGDPDLAVNFFYGTPGDFELVTYSFLYNGVTLYSDTTTLQESVTGVVPYTDLSSYFPGDGTYEVQMWVTDRADISDYATFAVDITGIGTPIPEPSTYALLGSCLAFVAWMRRRRIKEQV